MSYWATLGLEAGAPLADVKSAFRNLAKQFHPDLNPGCQKSEKRFKEISAAYDVLKSGDAPEPAPTRSSRQARTPQTYSTVMTLSDAAWGLKWLATPHGALPIPAGVRDGDVITYDAYTKVRVTVETTHGCWERKGDDLYTTLEVKQRDLESGKSNWFNDHPGTRCPQFYLDAKRMKDGTTVRIRNKGMPKTRERGGGYGNCYVKLKVIPTPSLWARRSQRETWDTGEQLLVATFAALVLVTGVMAISLGIVTFLLP